MKEALAEIIKTMERELDGSYVSASARAAYRAGLSTAAAICDAKAAATRAANPGRRKGEASQVGQFGADIATSCGDAIMDARNRIKVPR